MCLLGNKDMSKNIMQSGNPNAKDAQAWKAKASLVVVEQGKLNLGLSALARKKCPTSNGSRNVAQMSKGRIGLSPSRTKEKSGDTRTP